MNELEACPTRYRNGKEEKKKNIKENKRKENNRKSTFDSMVARTEGIVDLIRHCRLVACFNRGSNLNSHIDVFMVHFSWANLSL